MMRLLLSLLFLPVFSTFLFAQTDSLQTVVEDHRARIGNGVLSVLWDAETKVLILDQNGPFARLALPEAEQFQVVKHPMQGRGGKTISGVSLVLLDGEETIRGIYSVGEENAFVVISTMFSKDMFKDGPAKTLNFPEIELTLPQTAEKLNALGTAGLRPVDGHKGSYQFLAVADPETRAGVVAGWISAKRGSGIVFSGKNAEDRVVLTPVIEYGKLLPPKDSDNFRENLSEVFVLGRFDDCRRGLERYAWQIARTQQIRLKQLPAGYCTWYADKFGGACDETEIVNLTHAAAEKLAPFGFNFVQIDDKWQLGETKNGPKKNFTEHNPKGPYPSGMKKTADMIRSQGMMAGIWFMPFSGSSEDPFWNKDWFVKSGVTDELDAEGKSKRRYAKTVNKLGEPYESHWGGTSLDATHPEFQKYLFEEVRRIAKDWNYNYFKLDGLWTGMANEQLYINNEYRPDDLGEAIFHDPSLTPIEAYRKGFEIIREAAGDDVFLLGCNVSQNMRTMGASFGCVDAMRIGPDNGVKWGELKRGPWHGSNRYFLNGRVWWNDPDPVYVRDSMPLEHARLIASWVAVSGQLYAFSDWLPSLSEERVEVLRRTIRPHGLRSARPVDLFNEDLPKIWHLTTRSNRPLPEGATPVPERDLVALFNWDEEKPITVEATPQWIGLPEAKEYVAFDFWGNKFSGSFTERLSVEVPPASCVVLAVRSVADHPILLSTSQHVTQGIVDVVDEEWDPETKTLSGASRLIAGDDYELRIYDPATKEIRRETLRPDKSDDAFRWSVEF